jgi:3-hydroxyethyl bacteriochlorophyllide a dehydrogenase
MSMITSCAVAMEQGRVALRDIRLRDLNPGEVLIATAYSCISPGTELRFLAGRQVGSPTGAFIPGYALTGTVAQSRAPELPEGTPVFCAGTQAAGDLSLMWGGHVGYALTDAARATVIPAGVPLDAASLAALGAIALHGVRRAEIRRGERVACVGLGPIGQFSARICRSLGAEVAACDLAASRVDSARAAGIHAERVGDDGLAATLQRIFPQGADVVVDSTGAAGIIGEALAGLKDIPWDNSRPTPNRYVVQGSYPGEFALSYNEMFCKEVLLHVPRNYQTDDLQGILAMMAAEPSLVDGLISRILPPEEAMSAYDALRRADAVTGTIAFDWQGKGIEMHSDSTGGN